MTDALRILFEETGRRVTVAHSVREAVAAGESDPPDLLLLDLSLPDGDGLEVSRTLRSRVAGAVLESGSDGGDGQAGSY